MKCIFIGASSLLASFLIKKLPDSVSKFLVPKISDAKITGETENKIIRLFNKVTAGKATDVNAVKKALGNLDNKPKT